MSKSLDYGKRQHIENIGGLKRIYWNLNSTLYRTITLRLKASNNQQ